MTMKQLKKFAFIGLSALMLQGCTAALLGGAAVGTKVATDPRSTGTQIDDETLEFKVYDAITKDEQIKAEGRVVVVSYSNRLLLIGQVPTDIAKETATNLAKGVEGVNAETIFNEMSVGPVIDLTQRSKDSWITSQVKSKMLVDSAVKTTDVKVITENNQVFLMGNVTQQQGNTAAEIARNISGVTRVVKVFKYLD
ncbi:division/outer membrane stress-associated lipid-binding lipoprotein [Bisgaard Taxon 10/6]|uniref:Division/outer membrane stress-associated lipid-binding lipoprotein n=1 Tax=Exercitatus varius TaxID=67857 RepID=A0AAW6Q5M8_9PAST|nr:division/outer membrane stress-associated lipid-binding lipoprotein [Exercitatus varius]QOF68801.1 divisome-associated lipoprotein YraP [Actinobacillus sp. GY-402]MDG2915731.1 division/outer membrane stress-associated lipid-binding lipoprotein [Exercitatus varius]MDG2916478.1 division/outer membrane stress-associated lipid-binding lipoprotein [Exercitatus varius]MDG2938615.1 division/outer membrane stress-associated lipid-binding lipoprotein [Exercitatus varius]MDG2946183.1 division/outer m